MNNLLKDAIYRGDIGNAIAHANKISIEELEDLLIEWSFNEPNIIVYTFLTSYLESRNDARLHSLASDILCHPLCHLEGAYLVAFIMQRSVSNWSLIICNIGSFYCFC